MGELLNPATALSGLQSFLETGGNVLVAIMIATFIMWAFILERFAYWRLSYPRDRRRAIAQWREAPDAYARWRDRPGYYMRYLRWRRDQIISEVRQKAEQNVEFVKTMVAIAPLLGLLGTVTGMVEVFDVMAATGSSSARAMSAGVSKATIPTMAGMVSALSGLFLSNLVERASKQNIQRLADELRIE